MRSKQNGPILLAVVVSAVAIPLLLAQPTVQPKITQTVALRIILAGPEGSPQPPGSALVKIKILSAVAVGRRSWPDRLISRSCTNTTGNQQAPANAVVADAQGGSTLRFPPGTVATLSATTDQGSVAVSGGGPGGQGAAIINGAFTAFEGCGPTPNFSGSKRHCQLKLPASGQTQVKALFSR